ncbi:hypothetical protein Hanom_Chr06g00504841 [Helianthus anomalus]
MEYRFLSTSQCTETPPQLLCWIILTGIGTDRIGTGLRSTIKTKLSFFRRVRSAVVAVFYK